MIPARLQGYLSGGKPVLAMIGSGAVEVINKVDCGYAVPAGDSDTLVKVIREKVLPGKEEFAKLGENSRRYYDENFRMDMCIDNLEKIIEAK